MSTWTSVVGGLRIDGLPDKTENGHFFGGSSSRKVLEELIGPMCLYENWNERSTLPRGSEGSIQYSIIEYYSGFPWVMIPIWGDLRDFQDSELIKTWWNKLLKSLEDLTDEGKGLYIVRDGCLRIEIQTAEPIVEVLQVG